MGLIHEDLEQVRKAIRGALSQHQPYCLDYRILLPDTSERVVWQQSTLLPEPTIWDGTGRYRGQIGSKAEFLTHTAKTRQ